ncbi:hypothetical protein [Neobacillus sp. YIM B06451]|uniref:hypothetical protein n=1 Tax=Neobacillus sp. YIM B06451 TaxID=3070994 RepID=UPI0029307729|nr:hypothetical protein [Neobacillus sp. YIM B06451]
MTMFDIELIIEVKQREIEENAKDAWKHSYPKEERNVFSFFKKKTKVNDCPHLCEA